MAKVGIFCSAILLVAYLLSSRSPDLHHQPISHTQKLNPPPRELDVTYNQSSALPRRLTQAFPSTSRSSVTVSFAARPLLAYPCCGEAAQLIKLVIWRNDYDERDSRGV
jgi:hypothetical protein